MMCAILVMAQYALLISADLPQIYLCSKFEDSIPYGYLETEPNAQFATYQVRLEV